MVVKACSVNMLKAGADPSSLPTEPAGVGMQNKARAATTRLKVRKHQWDWFSVIALEWRFASLDLGA